MRHSYATAALKAGVPAKVISERLGHSSAAFTQQTYTHVIPGMDELAAGTVARLILGEYADEAVPGAHGSIFGSIEASESAQESKEPADLVENRRSAGSSSRSGGRI